ncbi:MAG: PAS domain S-box protein [Devosia sp.]|nr:PAS domain S-box protein [Devosia sp.]
MPLWRNDAARFFHGKMKKRGVKLAPEAVPIRGQIARLIRLGSLGRSSLSRIQFLAGDRPISTTCTCTPLELDDGSTAMLIVGVDPLEPELLEAMEPGRADTLSTRLFPPGAEYLLVSDDSQIAAGSARALTRFAPIIESEGLPALDGDSGMAELAGERVLLTRFRASPQDAMLLLFEPAEPAVPALESGIAEVRSEEGLEELSRPVAAQPVAEPLLPIGLPPDLPPPATTPAPGSELWVEPILDRTPPPGTLSSLFDRLADDDGLFGTLVERDATFAGPPPEVPETIFVAPPETLLPAPEDTVPELPDVPVDEVDAAAGLPGLEAMTEPAAPEAAEETPALDAPPEPALPAEEAEVVTAADLSAGTEPTMAVPEPEIDHIAELIAAAETEPAATVAAAADDAVAATVTTWRVIGRGFEPIASTASSGDESQRMPATPDAETVERVSRYNFDELSRILSDRVGGSAPPPAAEVDITPASSPDGALISLAGETFILNRLPLGIMVFRDQQVLFANRALTELTGYDSIESLRAAGLTAIFPAEDSGGAGPVTQLVRRDGSLAPVNARLQSINWHGRPALMLSASMAERRGGHEAAVRAFAELHAEASDEGFVAADRSGTITAVSLHGRILLGRTEDELIGHPLAGLVEPEEIVELKRFLERPARFAETARPAIVFRGRSDGTQLVLFAEGQAGVVAGYFGTLRKLAASPPVAAPPAPAMATDDVEPSMLVRISRGVRRPLNSIIGFADLIHGAASGSPEAQRQAEYARDIKTAGIEIATLVDELDDYARLREGRYEAQADDIELGALLDTCLLRVKSQAAAARVLVRSAVSERLPHITADRASLTQAILNLLASAIDQTPGGGTMILSAQLEDSGAVVVNVRDTGERRSDLGERFVVFRDGIGRDGETLAPVRSSVGLALTRSLLAVNALSLSVDPVAGQGTLFSLVIPSDLVKT